MSLLNAGEVELDLGDSKVVLKPTLGAAMAVCDHFDGFVPAYEKVRKYNLSAMIAIAQAGAGLSGKEAGELAGKVFKAGVIKCQLPILEFIGSLSRGGQSEEDVADKGDEEKNAAG